MSSISAISARRISKRFTSRRGHRYALREAIENMLHIPTGQKLKHQVRSGQRSAAWNPGTESLSEWALCDVSFEIEQGECVGMIGHNGAGKSLLLRILTRVTRPTTGEAEVRGSLGAVLDVGAGFNRELTGRENIYFQGAILGMNKAEIARKFDAIVDFSGLEEFLDLPLKSYSSGMQVRLNFAVAAQLEPQIIIMDEVLAVADADFIRSAVGKLQELARHGCTIVLVGHDLDMIAQVSQRILWLEHGRIVEDGAAPHILDAYRAKLAARA